MTIKNSKNISCAAVSCIIAAVVFSLYLPVLRNDFVNWDDAEYVYDNKNIRAIDLNFLKWNLTAVVNANWHPLTIFSYALDYSVWGIGPLGCHLTNTLFHAANTLLVFTLVMRLIECCQYSESNSPSPLFAKEGARGSYPLIAASVTALLFGIHPIHVESVAWASERKDVLYAFFYLLSLLAYLKYNFTSEKRFVYYSMSLAFFIMSLMSKPIAVSLPVVLLIFDIYPLGRFTQYGDLRKAKWLFFEKLPFFLLTVILSVVTFYIQRSENAVRTLELYPIAVRFLDVPYAYILYLIKMILPFNLSPFYPDSTEAVILSFEYAGSITGFAIITFFCVRAWKTNRVFLSVWLYFLVSFLPVIGVIKAGDQLIADRYTYLPGLAPFFLAGIGIGTLYEQRPWKWFKVSVISLLIVFSGLVGVKTALQGAIWRDSITLWSYVIKLFPKTARIAYDNRGAAYVIRGDYYPAISDLEKALEIEPRDFLAHYNLGIVYGAKGRFDDAVRHYDAAIALKPEEPTYYNNLAAVYYKQSRFDDAEREWKNALMLRPDFTLARYNLGQVYARTGRFEEARVEFEEALRTNPDFLPAQRSIELLKN